MSEAIDAITEETEVSTTELACVLGITGRRIRQMAEDGQLQKVSKGRFLLADSVQRYVKFLSDGPMDEEDKKLEKTRRMAETTMKGSAASVPPSALAVPPWQIPPYRTAIPDRSPAPASPSAGGTRSGETPKWTTGVFGPADRNGAWQ